MGKKTRKKNRHGSKSSSTSAKSKTNNPNIVSNTSTTSSITSDTNTNTVTTSINNDPLSPILSPVINRIRHGDPRVRHGALSGLSSTFFSADSLLSRFQKRRSCSSSSNNNSNSDTASPASSSSTVSKTNKMTDSELELLKAMSQRVLDNDMPCAICAAGCLTNYILFGMTSSTNSSSSITTKYSTNHEETVGNHILGPILLARIDTCCIYIQKIMDDEKKELFGLKNNITTSNNNNSNINNTVMNINTQIKNKKKRDRFELLILEQFTLLSLCLRSLCGLIEMTSSSSSSSSTSNNSSFIINDSNQSILSTILNNGIIKTQSFLKSLFHIVILGMDCNVITSSGLRILEECKITNDDTPVMNDSMDDDNDNVHENNKAIISNETNNNNTNKEEDEIGNCIIYALRILHSSFDEHLDLVTIASELNIHVFVLEGVVESLSSLPLSSYLVSSGLVLTPTSVTTTTTATSALATTTTATSTTVTNNENNTTNNKMVNENGIRKLVTIWDIIEIIMMNNGRHVTPLAKVHCAGILVTARHLLVPTNDTNNGVKSTKTTITSPITNTNTVFNHLNTLLKTHAMPILIQQFTFHNTQRTISKRTTLQQAFFLMNKEKKDSHLEENVIRTIDNRGEKARSIAKRLKVKHLENKKKKKEAAAAAAKQQDSNDTQDDNNANANATIMKDDTDNVVNNNTNNNDDKNNDDNNNNNGPANDNYDQTLQDWNNYCLPLKVAIEVTTNLFAGGDYCNHDENDNTFDNDDDDGMDWDSQYQEDDKSFHEPLLLRPERSNDDTLLFGKALEFGLPDAVLTVFGGVLIPVMNSQNSTTSSTTTSNSNSNSSNDEIIITAPFLLPLQDLTDVLSKCTACLANIIDGIPQWKSSIEENIIVWKELCRTLGEAVVGINNGQQMILSSPSSHFPLEGIASICSLMSSLLRLRPNLLTHVEEQDLDMILSCILFRLPITNKIDDNKGDDSNVNNTLSSSMAVSDIQKHAVSMIGLLSSKQHTDEVNRKICTTLLKTLSHYQSNETAVMAGILDSLMDMYSVDEDDPLSHETIFKDMNVLDAFINYLPILKRKIRQEECSIGSSNNNNINPNDLEMSKETFINTSRFIKYKKDRMV